MDALSRELRTAKLAAHFSGDGDPDLFRAAQSRPQLRANTDFGHLIRGA